MWKQIAQLPATDEEPWTLLGDLNEIATSDERESINKGSSTRFERFNRFIQDNNLIDLDLQGN